MFSFPYREARDGFWGAHTSTINWCEEDYNMTYYCAELVNTVTNLMFLYLGYTGIRNCLKYSEPPIFILAYLGYTVVGIGSMAFHATLKYEMQLADELPMIYTVCIMGVATFSYNRSRLFSAGVAALFIFIGWAITAYYLNSKDPVFHQVAYALMTCWIVYTGIYDMQYRLRPALEKRNPADYQRIMKQMWQCAFAGQGLFLFGFFIWNMDNIYCHSLKAARNHILLPWAIVLEGHGWWHIFTGLGGYYFITWRLWLHRCLDGDEKDFKLRWPSIFTSVPQVVPRPAKDASSNGAPSYSEVTKKAQ
jgi:dihydroceramidase